MDEMEIDLFSAFLFMGLTDGREVPARFVEHLTSSDVEAPEDSTVSLRCVASGSPMPEIKWRREDGQSINMQDGEKGLPVSALIFRLNRIHADVIPQLRPSPETS